MRLFAASIATETNTYAPMPTSLESYKESTFFRPGEHPDDAKLCTAPLWVARHRAKKEGWTLIEGSCFFAEPAGLTSRAAYEFMRDEILDQLRAAMPVDGVLLGLHGAMVADGTEDCEGDVIERVRRIVGPKVPIGVEHDPHCHLTRKRVANSDFIICFKEFPHTDFVDRGEEVVDMTIRTIKGEIRPVMSVFDCRMIGSFPTTLQPMRGFVDKITALEGKNGVLSISVAHCFPYADVPEIGAKIIVVTDDRKDYGDKLATELGWEFFGMRGKTTPSYFEPDGGIDEALKIAGPVVMADPADNAGGGAASDNTTILRRMIERKVERAALGPLWDPMAVRICFDAGEGAKLRLRFGGKTAPTSGQPIDAEVTVLKLVRDAYQTFVDARVPLGDCAAIRLPGEIDVVMITKRTQALGTDLFTGLGVDLAKKKLIVVKSTNHFHAAFSKIAAKVIYCDADGPIPRDHRKVPYTKIEAPIWPLQDNVAPTLWG